MKGDAHQFDKEETEGKFDDALKRHTLNFISNC